jgi:O-antigen/teichoic acid export membrane protein
MSDFHSPRDSSKTSGCPAVEGDESVPVGGRTVDRGAAARSALWSLAENSGLAIVSFATLIVLARYLSPADFGLFSIVLAVVELLGVIVSMLFHDALVQREKVTELHFDTAFTVTFVLSLLLLGACWQLGPWFSSLVRQPSAREVLAWTALALPLGALSTTIAARHRRELRFRVLAARSLVGRLSGAAIGILLAFMGFGYWSLSAQHVLTAATGAVVLWVGATHPPRLRFGQTEIRDLIGFGALSVSGMLLSFALKRVFIIVAGVLLGTDAAGYLNMSFRVLDAFWALSATAVTQVAFPVLARLQDAPNRLRSAFGGANEIVCMLLYPTFIGIAVTAPEVVELLLGPQWESIAIYISWLAMLVIVQAPRMLITPMLKAKGWPGWVLVGIGVDYLVIFALIASVGVPSVGVVVAIWMVREVLAWPVMAYVLKAKVGIGFLDQLRGLVTPALAALAMAIIALAVRSALGAEVAPPVRLLAIVGASSLAFVCAATLLDRPSVLRLWSFFRSARRMRTA